MPGSSSSVPKAFRSGTSNGPRRLLFHTTRRCYAAVTAEDAGASTSQASDGPPKPSQLPFPRSSFPTPFEIFHLPRSCTTSQVKQRYYDLVKLYHPDKASPITGKGKARDDADAADEVSRRFQLITDAYELLRNPTKRQMYLRTGEGWSQSYAAISAARHSRGPRRSFDDWREEQAAAIRRRDRGQRGPMRGGTWAWMFSSKRSRDEDYGPFGEGFYTSNRAEDAGTWREHWHHRGALGKNGVIFSSIASVSLLLYASQVWRVYGAKKEIDEGWAEHAAPVYAREPEGDARLDADAWHALSRSPSSEDPAPSRPHGRSSSSSLAPMHLAPLVKAAEERHRNASEMLRDARAAAREPWTLVSPRCSDAEGTEGARRRSAPGKKWGEMYQRMLDERDSPDGNAS